VQVVKTNKTGRFVMTKCNQFAETFQAPKGRKFDLNFSGGNVSSDAGLVLLAQLDKKLGLTANVAKVLQSYDKRQKGKVDHKVVSMLRQRVYGIASGYEDLNDHEQLSSDEFFQSLVGTDEALASTSTLSRFENRACRELCVSITKCLVESFIKSW
jgi:hypothetical protein